MANIVRVCACSVMGGADGERTRTHPFKRVCEVCACVSAPSSCAGKPHGIVPDGGDMLVDEIFGGAGEGGLASAGLFGGAYAAAVGVLAPASSAVTRTPVGK
jgi:hypothetical protein